MSKRPYFIAIALLLCVSIGLTNCNFQKEETKKSKYVFYFIGDGLSLPQIQLTENYLSETDNGDHSQKRLQIRTMPVTGIVTTYAHNRLITCSAASGTALSTGFKTSINTIGLTPDRTTPLTSITQITKDNGYKTGIISTVSIDNATPAAFYAHVPSRSLTYEIGKQLTTSGYHFFGGGGFEKERGENEEDKSLSELAAKEGYRVIKNNNEFMSEKQSEATLLFIHEKLDRSSAMPYEIDKTKSDLPLSKIVEKSIELLYNEQGFFIMIEGGKIDWACHNNDAATMVHEITDFDNAIKVALQFYEKHPDETLIVVAADHETGGLTLGAGIKKYNSYPSMLKNQKISLDSMVNICDNTIKTVKNVSFRQITDTLNKYFAYNLWQDSLSETSLNKLKTSFNESIKKQKTRPFVKTFIKMYNLCAGISWATSAHTSLPTLVFAKGKQATSFSGYYDNTEIPRKIVAAMGIDHQWDIKTP